MTSPLLTHTLPLLLTLPLWGLCLGCDDEPQPRQTPQGGAGVEAGAEAGVEAGAEADSGIEAGMEAGVEAGATPPQGCALSATRSQDLLPQLRSTQIHPSAVWDGEAFWVSWTIPNDERKFEVWAGRFGCDLAPLVEPFALSQAPGMNDTDSSVAVSGERVLVAWSRDNGFADGAEHNLSVQLRALDRQSGEPLGEAHALALSLKGEGPAEGNLWMPQLTPHPEGGFMLAASWGNVSLNTFQLVLLSVSLEGEEGEAWLADPTGRDQLNAQVAYYGRTLDVLWTGSSEAGADGFWAKSWRLSSPEGSPDGSESVWEEGELIDLTARGWLSAGVGRGVTERYEDTLTAPRTELEEGAPWLIGARAGGVVDLLNPQGEARSVGRPSVTNLGPQLSYGLIAAYERISNTQSKVWRRELTLNSTEELQLLEVRPYPQDGPAAPYPLSVTPFPGGHLTLWAQGQNPEFMLKATLTPLSP